MKLIRETESRRNKAGHLRYYAIFYCEYCFNYVERRIEWGKLAKSCGCFTEKLISKANIGHKYNLKHGESKTRLYKIWLGMRNRCYLIKDSSYKNYGGRGITICPEWAGSYIVFRDWALNNGYAENLTIDRKDPNGNYEPSNCRWITRGENSQKTRLTKLSLEIANEIRYLYNTGNYTQKELCIKFSICNKHLRNIINNLSWKNI